MHRLILLFVMLLAMVMPMAAQNKGGKQRNPEEMRKELEEFKMKFIAQEIDLKEDQQKQFFELYSQMSEEKAKIFKEARKLEHKVKHNSSATEADYAAVSKAITEAREKDAQLEKKYDEKFATVLTSKQIFKMKDAEEKFRRKMQEMREKRKSKSEK